MRSIPRHVPSPCSHNRPAAALMAALPTQPEVPAAMSRKIRCRVRFAAAARPTPPPQTAAVSPRVADGNSAPCSSRQRC